MSFHTIVCALLIFARCRRKSLWLCKGICSVECLVVVYRLTLKTRDVSSAVASSTSTSTSTIPTINGISITPYYHSLHVLKRADIKK